MYLPRLHGLYSQSKDGEFVSFRPKHKTCIAKTDWLKHIRLQTRCLQIEQFVLYSKLMWRASTSEDVFFQALNTPKLDISRGSAPDLCGIYDAPPDP